MSTISDYVRDHFDGMLVIGDVHGDIDAFSRAANFATSENFFLMSLGDLVDRVPYSFEVVHKMHSMVYDGRAGFVLGNHDDKHYRHIKGNKVRFSRDAQRTLVNVGEERLSEFNRMYCEIIEDPMLSGLFHKFGDIAMVHAASHHSLWDGTTTDKKSARSRFLVGETDGKLREDGFPVRLYNWVEEIPQGKTLIVGHDHEPVHGINIHSPMVVKNSMGGTAVFMDTGNGKGGHLSGAVVLHHKDKFVIDNFMEFK
jgi:predicted phosphodiesterase